MEVEADSHFIYKIQNTQEFIVKNKMGVTVLRHAIQYSFLVTDELLTVPFGYSSIS